jgi:long-chain acyl-CoA synthetase
MQNIDSQTRHEKALYERYTREISKNGVLMYIGRLLERAAHMVPQRVALICRDKTITYQELYRRACAFSTVLKQKGVKPRDRVLLYFENSIEFYIGYFGVLHAGAVIAPLNTLLGERELAHIITDSQPTLMVAQHDLLDRIKNMPSLTIPILTEKDMPIVAADEKVDETIIECKPEELAALLYTSGTTGLPKGVMLSSRNMISNVMQGLTRYETGQHETVFGVLPMFHSFTQNTCIWLSLFRMYTVIVVPHIDRRAIMEGLKHKPTIFLGVPALYGLLCLLKTAPLDSVRLFISGADALPDKIRAGFALIYRRRICSGYGMTETSPIISVDLDDETVPTSNVGRPCYGVHVEVRDAQEVPVPQGQIGQLWISGDNVMMGYYNAPDQTNAVLKNGWLASGDLGYLDTKGRIVITGRSKDLIIHKGVNIYPQEIENVIVGHANVLRAAVIGIPDEATGEVPVAYVQVRENNENMERELKALCMRDLAAYKVPRVFICNTRELPTTATGKVDKKKIRAEHSSLNKL